MFFEKMFLEISQNSQENNCVKVCVKDPPTALLLKKETPKQVFYCEFCKNFKENFF